MPIESCCFIEDGFTVTTTIPAAAGLHPAVKVTYRPALSEERDAYQMGLPQDVDGKARSGRECEILKRHLESWDCKTRGGQPVKTTDDHFLRRLVPALKVKLFDLVMGYRTPQEGDAPEGKDSSPASSC